MTKQAYLAGGCFWGLEELFRTLPGVSDTEAGYTGGTNDNPTYEHHPGHAEALCITYDADKISYKQLLDFFFQIHNPTTLAGYFKLDNIMGEPALIIKIDVPREITAQGEDTIRAFLLISIVSILLLGGTILILLEKLLLRRFAQLSKEMRAISMDNLSFAEVHMGGKDDVGKLAEQINHLFDELAKYKKLEERELQKQQELNQKEKESNESLRKSLEEKAGMNKLMVERELKMIELKKEISRLKEELAQYR